MKMSWSRVLSKLFKFKIMSSGMKLMGSDKGIPPSVTAENLKTIGDISVAKHFLNRYIT